MGSKLRSMKQKREEKQEEVKVQRQKEEVIATAGGFLFMGGYVMITGTIPETALGWVKFVGLFILISAVLYLLIWGGKKIMKKSE